MLIKLLKIRIGDLNWNIIESHSFFNKLFIDKMNTLKRDENNGIVIEPHDVLEVSRLQAGELLSDPDYQNEFMSIFADSESHNFYFSIDSVEKKINEERNKKVSQKDVNAFSFGDDDDSIYYDIANKKATDFYCFQLIKTLAINRDLNDPFVHFDYNTNTFYLPRKVLELNKLFVEEFKLPPLSEEEKGRVNELESLLTYNFRAGFWVYKDIDKYLETDEISSFADPGSWLIPDTVEEANGFKKVETKEGVSTLVPILTLEPHIIEFVRTSGLELNEKEVPNFKDVKVEYLRDYQIKNIFNSEKEVIFGYLSEPIKQFILFSSGEQKSMPVAVVLGNFNEITEKLVFDLSTNLLIIPIRAVSVHVHSLLTHMKIDWLPDDYLQIGYNRETNALSEGLVKLIVKEFIEHYIRSKNLQTALYYYLYTVSGLMNPTLDLDAEVKRLYDRVKDVMPEVDTLKLTDESIKAVEALLFKIEK